MEPSIARGLLVTWNFEKTYDRFDREALWEMLRIYGLNSKLLDAVESDKLKEWINI